MKRFFAVFLICAVLLGGCSFDALKAQLDDLSRELNVQIRTQRSEIFEAMHQI